MKRFWSDVKVQAGNGGFGVTLDGRPLRTPGRAMLAVPTAKLAHAIAAEWKAVDGDVDPRALPLTGIANAAIDIVAPDPASFAATLARYAESDLTCYRAVGPQPLVARQVAAWEAPLKAVEARHGLLFRRTAGITPVAQPKDTLARVQGLLERLDPWRLAALQPIVTLCGSLVLALALMDGALTADGCVTAACVDEDWQAEHWGEDADAAAQMLARRHMVLDAAQFLALAEA